MAKGNHLEERKERMPVDQNQRSQRRRRERKAKDNHLGKSMSTTNTTTTRMKEGETKAGKSACRNGCPDIIRWDCSNRAS